MTRIELKTAEEQEQHKRRVQTIHFTPNLEFRAHFFTSCEGLFATFSLRVKKWSPGLDSNQHAFGARP